MSDQRERLRVSVYFDGDDEGARARDLLRSVDPERTYIYQGVVDGWVTAETLEELKRGGFSFALTGGAAADQKTAAPPAASGRTAPGVSAAAKADQASSPQSTFLRRSKFSDPDYRAQIDSLRSALPEGEATEQEQIYLVRLKERVRADWETDLRRYGTIRSRRASNVLEMQLDADNLPRVSALPYVATVRRAGIVATVTPELLDALRQSSAPADVAAEQAVAGPADRPPTPATRRLTLEAVVHTPEELPAVKSALESGAGVEIVGESATALRFSAAADRAFLARLAAMPEVKSLSTYTPPTLLCDRARCIVGVDVINAGAPERWTGAGESVAIFDSGVDPTHPDLIDRIEATVVVDGASERDAVGHGTHIAGIIAGSGSASGGQVRGIAPGARLVVVSMTDNLGRPQLDRYVDLGELLALATNRGAKILNLSWGGKVGGSYDHGSASVDKFVYEHPNVLVVVAAGNAGAEDENGDLRFNTVSTPATAKNVLTVGASATDRAEDQYAGAVRVLKRSWAVVRPSTFASPVAIELPVAGDPDLPAAVSSRGPTDYDSIKPDVLAPGTFILSARAANVSDGNYELPCDLFGGSYAYLTGSSMAAPVVSGAAAVLRQYLREACGVSDPSAALLRALLIASTRRLPSTTPPRWERHVGYPDFGQGHGRIDLSSILPHQAAPPGRKLLFADVPNDSADALQSRPPVGGPRKAVQTYSIQVPADAGELRVVLAWTDLPANYVQNNLQLEVRGPDQVYVGNADHVYRKDAGFDDASQDGQPFDKRNTAEQVRIEAPPAGSYRIRVIAQNTAHPPQGYALCVCGTLESDALTVGG